MISTDHELANLLEAVKNERVDLYALEAGVHLRAKQVFLDGSAHGLSEEELAGIPFLSLRC